jgi:hypothetical protein
MCGAIPLQLHRASADRTHAAWCSSKASCSLEARTCKAIHLKWKCLFAISISFGWQAQQIILLQTHDKHLYRGNQEIGGANTHPHFLHLYGSLRFEAWAKLIFDLTCVSQKASLHRRQDHVPIRLQDKHLPVHQPHSAMKTIPQYIRQHA